MWKIFNHFRVDYNKVLRSLTMWSSDLQSLMAVKDANLIFGILKLQLDLNFGLLQLNYYNLTHDRKVEAWVGIDFK